MDIPWETATQQERPLSGACRCLTYNRVYRWTLRRREQDEGAGHSQREHPADLRRAGLPERAGGAGATAPRSQAIDRIEKDLNLQAHDQ